jgi:glycosyltransferase involved in cell wall biosynthesis
MRWRFGDLGLVDRALLVSPEAPYPLHGGGAFRTAAILNYLAGRYRLDAILFREATQPDPREAIPAGLVCDSIVIDLPVHSRSPLARALRNTGRAMRGVPPLSDRFAGFSDRLSAFVHGRHYATAVVEHSWCAPYLKALRVSCHSAILNLHNIESRLHATRAHPAAWPVAAFHRRFAECSLALERQWLPNYDLVLAASQQDAALAREIAPKSVVEVYPNTIPFRDRLVADSKQAGSLRIAFSGNFDYDPNQSAVAWFYRNVWPRLRSSHPSLQWVLIGKNPRGVPSFVRSDPQITLTGEIDDAVAELAATHVAVVPLLAGSGTRVKILEAWAAGTPVVATSLGAEGLPGRNGEHLMIRDRPDDFGGAVSALLESPGLREAVAGRARALFESELTWESGWKRLERLGI